ncbi:MAG TPA: RHS repeat-associated core domain-containing protein [Thermoanaerobaculia bacterium]|nr:RHS repeat-associated core domain-containing protein [Thermoanaerobaculia bacterium]
MSTLLTFCALGQPVNWSQGVVYEYDGSGNVKKIGTDTYVYDTAQRLIRGTVTGSQQSYSYDSFGNRTACLPGGGGDCQYGFTVNSSTNRIANRTYDKRGNMLQLPEGNTLDYDELGMVRKETGSNRAVYYIYTADDERIAVYDADAQLGTHAWRWTVRGLDKKPLREFTSEGTSGTVNFKWSKDHIWRDVALLASRQLDATAPGGVSTYHYHTDHLGTPRQVTTTAALLIGRHDYLPFGPELPNATEPQQQNLKFTGHERDTPRDHPPLDYMHARYFEPRLGRFLSVDPTWSSADMGRPQSWNRYAYVRNSPINRTDPDGRVDGNGMGEPLEWESGGLERSQQLGISNRTANGTAKGALVIASLPIPGPEDVLITTAALALGRRLLGRALTRIAAAASDDVADAVKVEVSATKYGPAVEHIGDAQAAGHPRVLTIDRGATKARRAEAMKGKATVPGKDRDEYPPAMFKEGGQGSSVRPINPKANRGCGAAIGNQCRGLPDGTKVEIVPKP